MKRRKKRVNLTGVLLLENFVGNDISFFVDRVLCSGSCKLAVSKLYRQAIIKEGPRRQRDAKKQTI
jgi:hypothetical protein